MDFNDFTFDGYSHITKEECLLKDFHDFGVSDEKGRKVGSISWVNRVVLEKSETSYGYRREPGIYWIARVQPSRDRVPYGATQPWHLFMKLEDANEHVKRSVEATRKRYAKKYAA